MDERSSSASSSHEAQRAPLVTIRLCGKCTEANFNAYCVGWVEGGENHRQQGGKVLRPELCGRQLLLLQGHAAGLAGVALVNPVVYLNQRLAPKPLRHRGGDLSCRLPRGGMVDFKTGYRLKRGSDASGLVDYRSKSR